MRLEIRPKRILIIIALAAIALSLSGCVYLRLLSFKNQLKNFERNVVVEASPGLALSFPNPVVRNADFSFITKSPPTRIDPVAADVELWTWTFEKQKAEPGHKAYALDFQTRFESDLLTRMIIDEAFVDLIGRDFILTMFQSIGGAKINTFRRSASVSMNTDSLQRAALPTLANILETMGEPSRMVGSKRSSGDVIDCEYEFNFRNPENRKRAGQFKLAFKGNPNDPNAPVSSFRITGKGR